MLGCYEAVTLYHRTYDPTTRDDVWARSIWPQASWYGGQAVTVSGNGLATADRYTVRIATADALPIVAGDIVVRGAVSDTAGAAELSRRYPGGCFVVTRIQDNRRGAPALRHWRLEGK